MPPVFAFAAAAVAAIAGARVIRREWQRVNEALAQRRPEPAVVRERLPTLRRDPATGEWRPS